jgi:hypothetical protein
MNAPVTKAESWNEDLISRHAKPCEKCKTPSHEYFGRCMVEDLNYPYSTHILIRSRIQQCNELSWYIPQICRIIPKAITQTALLQASQSTHSGNWILSSHIRSSSYSLRLQLCTDVCASRGKRVSSFQLRDVLGFFSLHSPSSSLVQAHQIQYFQALPHRTHPPRS